MAVTRRGVSRDIAITTLAQASIGVGGLLLYRLLAEKKGAEGVAAYSLVKQTVVFFWPLVMLGLQTGIPRYVALGRGHSGAVEGYLLAAIGITGTTTVLVSTLGLVSPPTTASLLFGDADRTSLVFPLVATLAATVGFEVIYGYYRGHSRFVLINVVRILTVAVFPVILLVADGSEHIGVLISLMAAGVVVGTAPIAAGPIARALRVANTHLVRSAGRTLIDYGRRRIPGDLAAVVLFSVPTILAAHFVSLHRVAYLSTGIYVLATVSIAFQPIGMVFLPILARLCADDFEAARRYVALLATSAIHIAIFMTPQMVLFAGVAVHAWLGPDFDNAGTIITIVVAPAGLYVFNIVLRSALEAAAVTAYNARNNVISLVAATLLVTVLLATGIASPLGSIAFSFASGVSCLGLLTLISVMRVFRLSAADFALPVALTLGAAAAAAAWFVPHQLVGDNASLTDVLVIVAFEVPLAALYVGGLVRVGVTWPSELRRTLLSRS